MGRESCLSNVDKSTFSGLLKQFYLELNPAHALSGFCNAGIVPLEKQKMNHRVTSVSSASCNNDDSSDRDDNPSTSPRRLIEDEIMTPKTAMREAFKFVAVPRPSQLSERKLSANEFKAKMKKC